MLSSCNCREVLVFRVVRIWKFNAYVPHVKIILIQIMLSRWLSYLEEFMKYYTVFFLFLLSIQKIKVHLQNFFIYFSFSYIFRIFLHFFIRRDGLLFFFNVLFFFIWFTCLCWGLPGLFFLYLFYVNIWYDIFLFFIFFYINDYFCLKNFLIILLIHFQLIYLI